jgi:hypothetical protein
METIDNGRHRRVLGVRRGMVGAPDSDQRRPVHIPVRSVRGDDGAALSALVIER